jgi:flavin reductase (DIM6/NTAB) family NADH-FMN oxidoreductase RutF
MSRPTATDELSVTPDQFREFMANWPTAVAIITARARGALAGCTVNALMSLSVEPPLLVVSLATTSRTLQAIREAGTFAVNILCWDQRDLCERFCRVPQHERFNGVETRLCGDTPVLADAAASAVCTVARAMQCADHVLLIGSPQSQSYDTTRSPLVLHRRSHHQLPT